MSGREVTAGSNISQERMRARNTFRKTRRGERGYILITLMLTVTLLAISFAIAAPQLAFVLKRDREEEMIHRGVQYSRAIQHYYKKFGRYPTRIEDLQNTNNIRFLRRKYKDPITGKDFRLLHYGEVPTGMGGLGLAAGLAAAAGQGGRGGLGGVGMNAAQMQSVAAQAGMAAMATAMSGNMGGGMGPGGMGGGMTPGMGPGTGSGSSFGSSQSSSDSSGGESSGSAGGGSNTNGLISSGGATASQQKPGGFGSGSGQVFGGGPIIGVASVSKDESIREFANKNHYNDWNFIYDPSMDRGGLIKTPAQPMQGFGQAGQTGMPGQPAGSLGQPAAGQSGGFGQSSFGQSSFGQGGFGQSPGQPAQPQPAAPQSPDNK